jgi:CBS domain-containing protein
MPADLTPVVEFLRSVTPFDSLADAELERIASRIEIEYFRRGALVVGEGVLVDRLYVVRSGELTESVSSGSLTATYNVGDAAAPPPPDAASSARRTRLHATQDTLAYTLDRARFDELCREQPGVALFFTARAGERLHASVAADPTSSLGWTRPIASVVRCAALIVRGNSSIRQVASQMRDRRVSSAFVDHEGQLGIITDRDLRSRVVAEAIDVETPVSSIMSCPLLSIDRESSVLDAMLTMLQHGVHHLGVTASKSLVAAITVSDVVQTLAANPVTLVREVHRQQTLDGLIQAAKRRGEVAVQLIESGTRAADVHRILTSIGDSVHRRLLELFWKDHGGDAPERYAWLSFGSQARQEHALGSDQDNGLLLGEGVAADDARFAELSDWMREGLDACGYPRCRGDIMASNPRWRQPLSMWKRYFSQWIDEPSRDAVMHGSIFFDLRCVHGNVALADDLQRHICGKIKDKPLFIAHMARDALSRRPPIGLFGRLILERAGEHSDSLDLKHRGLSPIVDLARAYALGSGCAEANTLDRLRCAENRGALSQDGSQELRDAYEFISLLRLRHHAECLKQGGGVDNHLVPDELSASDRRHLRDAFSVVKTLQDAFEHSHQLGALSG